MRSPSGSTMRARLLSAHVGATATPNGAWLSTLMEAASTTFIQRCQAVNLYYGARLSALMGAIFCYLKNVQLKDIEHDDPREPATGEFDWLMLQVELPE